MLTEYNIKRHYDSKQDDSVYAKLKGRNQELKVDLFKRAARTMLCLLLFGPLLKKFAHPCSKIKKIRFSNKKFTHFWRGLREPLLFSHTANV